MFRLRRRASSRAFSCLSLSSRRLFPNDRRQTETRRRRRPSSRRGPEENASPGTPPRSASRGSGPRCGTACGTAGRARRPPPPPRRAWARRGTTSPRTARTQVHAARDGRRARRRAAYAALRRGLAQRDLVDQREPPLLHRGVFGDKARTRNRTRNPSTRPRRRARARTARAHRFPPPKAPTARARGRALRTEPRAWRARTKLSFGCFCFFSRRFFEPAWESRARAAPRRRRKRRRSSRSRTERLPAFHRDGARARRARRRRRHGTPPARAPARARWRGAACRAGPPGRDPARRRARRPPPHPRRPRARRAAARNARRRKRTLRRPELSFDENADDVARLAETFASASRPAAFGSRAAHPKGSASRAFAAARKRSNAAPEVMSSTARSHLSFGRGARAAATARARRRPPPRPPASPRARARAVVRARELGKRRRARATGRW